MILYQGYQLILSSINILRLLHSIMDIGTRGNSVLHNMDTHI